MTGHAMDGYAFSAKKSIEIPMTYSSKPGGSFGRPLASATPRADLGGAMREQPRSFWDGLVFGFSASLTLWQDLPPIQVVVVMVVILGAAMVALRGVE